MTTPKMGLRGEYVLNNGGGGDGPRVGTVTKDNGNGTVAAKEDFGAHSATALPFVQVGGTPPAAGTGDYFQAIDYTT